MTLLRAYIFFRGRHVSLFVPVEITGLISNLFLTPVQSCPASSLYPIAAKGRIGKYIAIRDCIT